MGHTRYLLLSGPFIFIVLVFFIRSNYDWFMTSQITTTSPRYQNNPFREEYPFRFKLVKAIETRDALTCTERTNVIFVKVHKAGSSTVSNILQRFGSFRKLNFVLPKKTLHVQRYNYIGEPGSSVSSDNIVPLPRGQHYNILCNHVTYNKTAFNGLFPTKQYFYLSIVRAPLQHFLSVIRYYGYSNFSYIQTFLSIKSGNPLSEYLRSPKEFEPETPYISYTNNRQSVDLGLPLDALGDVSAIHTYVETIRKDFDFIMLLEYFDESLVYLKRKLCWSYKDILYYPKNSRWNNNKYVLSVTDLARLRRWNSADHILYDELHSEFWKKIRNAGLDFFDEVLHFKRVTETVRLYCATADATSDLEIKESKWETNFNITNLDCQMLGLDELEFLDKIYLENYGIIKNGTL